MKRIRKTLLYKYTSFFVKEKLITENKIFFLIFIIKIKNQLSENRLPWQVSSCDNKKKHIFSPIMLIILLFLFFSPSLIIFL